MLKQAFLFRAGGLYRCCIHTLYDLAAKNELPQSPGEKLSCLYCKQEPTLILADDGVWQWIGISKSAKSF